MPCNENALVIRMLEEVCICTITFLQIKMIRKYRICMIQIISNMEMHSLLECLKKSVWPQLHCYIFKRMPTEMRPVIMSSDNDFDLSDTKSLSQTMLNYHVNFNQHDIFNIIFSIFRWGTNQMDVTQAAYSHTLHINEVKVGKSYRNPLTQFPLDKRANIL